MFFASPLLLWLLPLALTPFFLRMRYFIESRVQEVPTLFFLEKLLRRKQIRYEKPLLETILESLFICLLILLWAGPQKSSHVRESDSLLVLVDDSPSMQYFYGNYTQKDTQNDTQSNTQKDQEPRSPSKLHSFLSDALAKQSFQSIELQRLSAISDPQRISIKTPQDFIGLFDALAKSVNPKPWNSDSLILGLQQSRPNILESSKSLLLYSDFKENHFSKKANSTKSAQQKESTLAQEFQKLGYSTFFLKETPAPYVEDYTLARKNFFIRETLNLSLNVTMPSQTHLPVSLELLLNGKRVFLSKIDSGSLQTEAGLQNSESGEEPPHGSSKAATQQNFKINLLLDKQGVNAITVLLKKDDYVFHRRSKVVFVYPRISLSTLGGTPKATSVIQAIFAYDENSQQLSLSRQGDTIIVLSPSLLPRESRLTLRNDGKKHIFILEPTADFIEQAKALDDLGLQELRFESLEHTSVRSRFYWSEQQRAETFFNSTNPKNRSYLKLSASSAKLVRPLLLIDGNPVIFLYKNALCITLLSQEELTQNTDAHHLIWLYESLFALHGSKKLSIIENHDAFSQARDLAQLSSKPSIFHGDKLWVFENEVFLERVPPQEYLAAVLPAALEETLFPVFGSANFISSKASGSNDAQSATPSLIEWLLGIAFCLLLFLAYLFIRKTFPKKKGHAEFLS